MEEYLDTFDKKGLFIIFVFVLVVIIFNIYRNTPSYRFKRYILNRGFILEEDKTFYYKQISSTTKEQYKGNKANNVYSSYDYLYLDLYDKKLFEEVNEYNDKYESSLNINYKFSNKKIDFIYRINYNNNVNVIFKGKYNEDDDDFVCEKEFAHNIDLSDNEDDFCENASYYVKSFKILKNTIFKDKKIIKYLEKK